MRVRALLAAPATVLVLLGALAAAGTAAAQDTGPGTQACTDATQVAIDTNADAEALGLQLGVAQAEIERLKLVTGADAELAGQKIAAIEVALEAEADRAAACAPPTEPTPTPTPTPTPGPGPDPVFYENCSDAIAAGAAPIVQANDEPGYRPELDRDRDGVACEWNEDPAPTTVPAPAPGVGAGQGDFSQLDQVPSRAAETGGGRA